MKSAWELALERTGGALQELSEDKKQQLAEIDKKSKAKLAEIELAYKDKLAAARTPEEINQINDDMVTEKASVRSKMEREKARVRE